VEHAHVYFVSSLGILVHNGRGMPAGLGSRTGGVYIFYEVNGNTVRAYIGSAKDFWTRLGGENESNKVGDGTGPLNDDAHRDAVDFLNRDGTRLERHEAEGKMPRSRSERQGFLNTQEQILRDQ